MGVLNVIDKSKRKLRNVKAADIPGGTFFLAEVSHPDEVFFKLFKDSGVAILTDDDGDGWFGKDPNFTFKGYRPVNVDIVIQTEAVV